ncbi:uncharacterized protein LOC135471364 [Liolophura sinensis]|uniref:uncharacterized protein LOC135471364 n=1 Tax=Liolophura sinensis TaxID=3198878 RepID=UPI00315972D2
MGPLAVAVVIASICLFAEAQPESPCSHVKSNAEWVPNPENCQGFYICAFGHPIEQYCGDGMVWQPVKKVCCLKGSDLDTCTVRKESIQPVPKEFSGNNAQETCQPGMTTKLTHRKHCARYFDCAQNGTVRGLDEEHERECPYPELFNSKTGQCEDVADVECGDRIRPKDACEYEMNKCHRSHCIPCWARFPSCSGLEDGKRVWKGREKSPLYAVCENERVVKHGRCPNGHLFHPNLLECADAQTVLGS